MVGQRIVGAIPSCRRLPTTRADNPWAAASADEIPEAVYAMRHVGIVPNVVVAENFALVPGAGAISKNFPGPLLIIPRGLRSLHRTAFGVRCSFHGLAASFTHVCLLPVLWLALWW